MRAPGPIPVLTCVALLEDLPDKGLVRGQVGTVVELLGAGVYEVEFSDNEGRADCMLALRQNQLMALHHEPVTPALSAAGNHRRCERSNPQRSVASGPDRATVKSSTNLCVPFRCAP